MAVPTVIVGGDDRIVDVVVGDDGINDCTADVVGGFR
jgi:hypothetical protein